MRKMKTQLERWGKRAGIAVVAGFLLGAVSACDDLLDVDLPASLTDEALENPQSAETQINSIITQFECGYSNFTFFIAGHEDVFESIAGAAQNHQYDDDVDSGDCDSNAQDDSHYDQFSGSRRNAADLYEKLENEWTVEQVPEKEKFQAISALYTGANLEWMGSTLCEITVGVGELMTPDQTLTKAEDWIDTALQEIQQAGGDFEVPYGVSSSAETMAYGLRARIRWMAGDEAGALADAEQVPQGFTAHVTRESGPFRRNKPYIGGTAVGFSGMLGVNDWWTGSTPNPVTGEAWPDIIPFTGYLFLGVMEDDGRAVHADGTPVRWAEEFREMGEDPTPLNNGAVPDPRVKHKKKTIQGPEPREVPDKYKAEADDIPLLSWKEIWLIRAEIEGGQTAIDLVNDLRAHAGLPEVTYADPSDEEQIRHMIIEERRRALFYEGRYYYTKIQNPDLLWFPRNSGTTPSQGYNLEGGVRLAMPQDEYIFNPNLTLDDRATGCDPAVRPVVRD